MLTKLAIFFGIVAPAVGGIMWAASLYTTTNQNKSDIEEIKGRMVRRGEVDRQFREQVISDLSKIKEHLHINN